MSAALWTEFGGNSSTEHPFATVAIAPGEMISQENVELRQVPAGLFDPVERGVFATRRFAPGEPIVVAGIGSESTADRAGWWALEIQLPASAQAGDEVQVVLLDSGVVVAGLVHSVGADDPLGTGAGTVAVPPEHAAEVAAAVANGRTAVLLST